VCRIGAKEGTARRSLGSVQAKKKKGERETMPSIRDLRDQRQRESFTGRQAEMNTFRRLLTADDPEYVILHVFGVGGIGKSSLLRQYRRIAQALGYPVAIVDMQVHFSLDEILRSVREQVAGVNERAFTDFDKALDMFNDVKSRLQGAVGSVTSGVVSGLREGVPLGLGALAVDTIGEEQMKAWLYRHLPRANADLYLHSDRILTENLIVGLNRLVEQNHSKIVVMFDTFEQSSRAQDDWLRDSLLDSELNSDVLIVVAGRDPLPGRWHEWRSVLLSLELHRFTEQEAREYLRRRGIDEPSLVEALQGFTERLPWALAMATDTPGVSDMTADDFRRASYRHVIGDKLVERFVSQVEDDPEMRELVDVCAVVRTFDHDVVRAIWERDEVDGPMRRLRRYSFVHVRADGRWSLNQVVREFLDQGLRRRSSNRWTQLNHLAANFYQEHAATLPRFSGEWNWYILESLYHQLRLDEDTGILKFAALFEEAKHLSRGDFCSELLNNIEDVQLVYPHSQHWITFYRGVMSRIVNTFGWDEAYNIDRGLYDQPDLPLSLRARVTTDLGRYYYQILGEYERAITMLHESLELRQDLDDGQGQAYALSHLAVAQSAVGDYAAGRESGHGCVQLAQQLGAPYRLGWGFYSLGVVESRAGDAAAAWDYYERGLEAFEAGGYEFEPGVVYYQMGHLALGTGDLDTALAHFRTNINLMLKYDKLVLAARTMVDICELYLLQGNAEGLAVQSTEVERLVVEQRNHPQMARLRLVQAEMLVRQVQDRQSDSKAVDELTDRYLDALLAGAEAFPPTLIETVERIEAQLGMLVERGRSALAEALAENLIGSIEQALEGVMARHGQLLVLPASARQPLQDLSLAQRWTDLSGR
jgi:tetratricopeptide (TPR) repeat protein